MDALRRDSPTPKIWMIVICTLFLKMNYNCEHNSPRAFWEAPTTAVGLRSEATCAEAVPLAVAGWPKCHTELSKAPGPF